MHEMVKIFSIGSGYSKKIFSNEKLVELRRRDVKVQKNEKCLIYTTSPVKRITGYFVVKEKIRLPLDKLWIKINDIAGLTKLEFMEYFKGCIVGTAILFKAVKKFIDGISLDEMKSLVKNFRPPQSYCNINERLYSIIVKKSGEPVICLLDL